MIERKNHDGTGSFVMSFTEAGEGVEVLETALPEISGKCGYVIILPIPEHGGCGQFGFREAGDINALVSLVSLGTATLLGVTQGELTHVLAPYIAKYPWYKRKEVANGN